MNSATAPVQTSAAPATSTVPAEPFIFFDLAGTGYAVRSRDILQLEMVGDITPVPNAPPFVDGVVSLRGKVVPVVNLRARFGFERVERDLRSRLLVVRSGTRTVALLVDSAREFATIPADKIQPPPDTIAPIDGRYLEGFTELGDRLVLLLDIAEVVNLTATATQDSTQPSPKEQP